MERRTPARNLGPPAPETGGDANAPLAADGRRSGRRRTPPAAVRATLDRWLLERSFRLAELEDIGCELRRVDPFGWSLVWPYELSNGGPAPERLLVLQGKAAPAPRWATGGAKGAVMVLGDPWTARLVVVVEGESCGLAAWLRRPSDDVAVIVIPGASMVGEDLANFVGNGALVVIATDADQGGDRCAAEAARVLAAAGIEPELIRRLRPKVEGHATPDLRDLLEWLDHAGQPDARSALGQLLTGAPPALIERSMTRDEHEDEWPQPEPLDLGPLPELRLDWFPDPLRDWISSVARAYQVPIELPAAMALGALSATVAGKAQVRLAADWTEELCLYLAVELPSGERKSPVVAEAAAPLIEWERQMIADCAEEIGAAQAAHDVLLKRLERAKANAAGAEGAARITAEERVRELAGELARSRPPVLPRLVADDATAEALTSLLADHGGRIAVLSAEGGLLDILAGRYSDGAANLDSVLKAYSGEPVRVDRKGRPAELIERPTLTLAVAVQPEVIETMRANRTMRGRGLLARFLYLAPRTALGQRELDPQPVPQRVRAAYRNRVRELLTLSGAKGAQGAQSSPREDSAPCAPTAPERPGAELTLSPGARDAFRVMRAAIEPRLDPKGGDLFVISDWAGKLPGAIARVAGLLHLAEHGPAGLGQAISAKTMSNAARIGEALIEHALAALGYTGPGGHDLARPRAVLAWIRRKAAARFSERDAFDDLRKQSAFPDMEALRPALAALCGFGYLRRAPDPEPRAQGGRPRSPMYEVNPTLLESRDTAS